MCYEERVFIESYGRQTRQEPGARSQKACFAFVILLGALRTAFYDVDASSINMAQLIPAPRTLHNVLVMPRWLPDRRRDQYSIHDVYACNCIRCIYSRLMISGLGINCQ
jgi:hypothetical protein